MAINKISYCGPVYKLNIGNYSSVQIGGHSLEVTKNDDQTDQDFLDSLNNAIKIYGHLTKIDMQHASEELDIELSDEVADKMTMKEFGTFLQSK